MVKRKRAVIPIEAVQAGRKEQQLT